MKRQEQGNEWPTTLAHIRSTVTGATIDRDTGDLHLTLQHSASSWNGRISLPDPWTFTSCLLSISSAQFEKGGEGFHSASDLIGLEGATLSAAEQDENQIDLIFGSIRLSVSAEPRTNGVISTRYS